MTDHPLPDVLVYDGECGRVVVSVAGPWASAAHRQVAESHVVLGLTKRFGTGSKLTAETIECMNAAAREYLANAFRRGQIVMNFNGEWGWRL